MTIPIPTIDDFDTSTVMTTLREVVDYLIGMVPQINSGDITDLQTTYSNNVLTVTLIKGDGTTISKQVTIQGGSGTESPYPTDVALSLSGTVLNCDIVLSNGSHVTGSQDLANILNLTTSGNNISLNGDSVQIVKSVSGSVTNGNLKISVNGVQSGDIPLPESDVGFFSSNFRKAFTSSGSLIAYNDDYIIIIYDEIVTKPAYEIPSTGTNAIINGLGISKSQLISKLQNNVKTIPLFVRDNEVVHNNSITAISATTSSFKIVSGGFDCCILKIE